MGFTNGDLLATVGGLIMGGGVAMWAQAKTGIQRVSIGVFLTVMFCGFSFAGSLENQELETIKPLDVGVVEAPALECSELKSSIRKYRDNLAQTGFQFRSFLLETAKTFKSWSSVLALREGVERAWEPQALAALRDGATQLQSSADKVYEVFGARDEQALALQQALVSCWGESEARSRAVALLEFYKSKSEEHFIPFADFLALMSARTNARVKDWARFEGRQGVVPVGTFSPLREEGESFREASELVYDNGQFVESAFQKFAEALDLVE
jgi:hypothetical protein